MTSQLLADNAASRRFDKPPHRLDSTVIVICHRSQNNNPRICGCLRFGLPGTSRFEDLRVNCGNKNSIKPSGADVVQIMKGKMEQLFFILKTLNS